MRLVCALCAILWVGTVQARVLRVCADPNNLPFSNSAGEGFENKIVALIAADFGASVDYTWWAQRRGYVRNTLNAGNCDLWPGVAVGIKMLATSRPYYRSSYMFVSRSGSKLDIRSFDDPRLRKLTIGVQMVGNDAMNTPPTHALARRGIIGNVRGYTLYGDYSTPNPPASIIDAVEHGNVDIAIVWGPLAGYFAARQSPPLVLTAVEPPSDGPQWLMAYDIGMGMRRGDKAFMQEIDNELVRRSGDIQAILSRYHVPVMRDGG